MILLNPDQIPLLPEKGIINDQCVAYGIFDSGIIVHYMDHDQGVLIEWADIVALGQTELHKLSHKIESDMREIAGPTPP